jgi:hypothetical protein
VTPTNASYYGGVLLPDERVFLVPYFSTTALLYNWRNDTSTVATGTYTGTASGAHIGGVLLPDGTVVAVPAFSTAMRRYDPRTDTLVNPDTATTFAGNNDYNNGTLLPDGRLFMFPRTVANPVIYGVRNTPAFDTNVTTSTYYNHK